MEPVRLIFNKTVIKCNFTEDNVLFFTQIEMETTETLKVQNTGNAKAFYRWVKGPESQNLFRIQPENGSIEPNSAFDFSIIYSPNAQSAGKLDDDRMIMKVSNASR